MDSVVIEIQQSLDQVSGQWDDSIGTPMIMKVNPDMMPVLAAAVDKDGMDANALSDYVKNDLAPALESLEGSGFCHYDRATGRKRRCNTRSGQDRRIK